MGKALSAAALICVACGTSDTRSPIEAGTPTRAASQPSMILIVIDTLRYDYLGVNGFQGDISPNLDRLAMESIRFEKAFATAPRTKPSTASIMTGLHPITHGVFGIEEMTERGHEPTTDVLSDEAVTLAETLRDHGYATAGFVANPMVSGQNGYSQGFDTFELTFDDQVLSLARDWLLNRDYSRPYFLYLHLLDVHGPYESPEHDYTQISGSSSLGEDRPLRDSDPPVPDYLLLAPWADGPERHRLRPWKARYAAGIRHLDRRLGDILNELRRAGRLEDDWLVVTADHGEEFLEHDHWDHGESLCDHQLHVPLWVRRPNAEGAGRRVESVMSLMDLMPTMLAVFGIPIPPTTQGEDRSEWLSSGFEPPSRTVSLSTGSVITPGLHTLRTKDHRLLWDENTNKYELFDLRQDPEAIDNVSASEPEATQNLQNVLVERLSVLSQDGSLDVTISKIPDQLLERLRALGYVQ